MNGVQRRLGGVWQATGMCWVAIVLAGALGCRNHEVAASTDAERLRQIEVMYNEYREDFPDTPEVTVQELLAMQEEGPATIVDGRDAEEREVSTIPEALPLGQLEGDLERYRDRPVVVYCTVGYRSGLQAKELREKGLEAYNLRGGMLAWLHAGQPVVQDGHQTKRVHVYGPKWDLAPEGYEAVW